eukprot:417081-Heterocapsa_arctica.AAC.1
MPLSLRSRRPSNNSWLASLYQKSVGGARGVSQASVSPPSTLGTSATPQHTCCVLPGDRAYFFVVR